MKNKLSTYSITVICFAIASLLLLNELYSEKKDFVFNKNILATDTNFDQRKNVENIKENKSSSSSLILTHSTQDRARAAASVVQSLSRKAILNQAEKNLMKNALMACELPNYIFAQLTDLEMLLAQNLEMRLRALDIVYEGLKNKDPEVNNRFRKLAIQLLDSEILFEISTENMAKQQFVSDRVELALIMS